MRTMIKFSFLAMILLGLSGCSAFRQGGSGGLLRRNDRAYLKSHSIARLQVPQGLSRSKISGAYVIPKTTAQGKIPASTKPPLSSSPSMAAADEVILRDDPTGYPGLLIAKTPSQTFSLIGKAISANKNYVINSKSQTKHLFSVSNMKTMKQYNLHLSKYTQGTWVYITGTNNKKLRPKDAQKVAADLDNILTHSVTIANAHSEQGGWFLKPFF